MSEFIYQYQNANQSYQSVIDNFVIRKKELERIKNDLETTAKEDSYQHFVFVGRRGSGKSTLLRRIQAEIELDPKLKQNYLAVNLSEEQSGIYKLFDLWDYVIRDLNAQGFDIEEVNFRDYKNDLVAYNRTLHNQIVVALRKANKRLVLLVDNFDRVLKNADEDTAFLREVLMNYKEIRIIGGSTVMSEHFWKYDKPFYQFFTIKRLEALSLVDIEALLTHWAKILGVAEIKNIINKYPGKIQSIRMLTDGSPRTMLLFVDMLLKRTDQNGYNYLQNIVDKATPIYQERLGTLSPAQAKVLTELAFIWEAATVDQLIQKCNMEGKTISALMSQLVSLRYVEKIDSDTKNKLYRLEERFFNLWINMTQGGPQQRHEAKALTSFLENWYDQAELKELAEGFSTSLRTGKLKPDYAESMSHALIKSKVLDKSLKQDLLLGVRKYTSNTPDEIIKEAFGDFEEAISANYDAGNYEKAIEILEISDFEEGKRKFSLGFIHEKLESYDLAEKYYLEAVQRGIIEAADNLANLYINQGKIDLAEEYFLKAIEKDDIDAIFNLAIIYADQGKTNLAEKYYFKAIEKGDIYAMNNLAILYKDQGKTDLAEKYYLEAGEKGDIYSFYNLAILYQEQGKTDLAEKFYLKAIEKGNIDAINSLAVLYEDNGKTDLAEEYYFKAVQKGNIDAVYNLASLYHDKDKIELAEKYYLEAIEKGITLGINNLLVLYYNKQDKDKLRKALTDYGSTDWNKNSPENYLIFLLYLGQIEDFQKKYQEHLKAKGNQLLSSVFLKDLLVHHQNQFVLEYFENNEAAKEEYKPLYFVLLSLLGHKDIIKMPPEISEIVNDMLVTLKNEQKRFYPHLA